MGKLKLKKLNRKGFTLIELLAVIVILAILILLAMPSVLNIMENARKNAFKTEVQSYLKAAQTKYTESMVDSANSSAPSFDNTDASNTKVDIEDKADYKYKIKVENIDDTMKYTYVICNESYYAAGFQKSFNADVVVKKLGDPGTTDVDLEAGGCSNSIKLPTSNDSP